MYNRASYLQIYKAAVYIHNIYTVESEQVYILKYTP